MMHKKLSLPSRKKSEFEDGPKYERPMSSRPTKMTNESSDSDVGITLDPSALKSDEEVQTLNMIDGSTYVGEVRNGKFDGFGTYTSAKTGQVYEGQWVNGKKQGPGKYTFSNKEVYEGEYHNNRRHGLGKYTFKDGSTYKGSYIRDMKDGFGVFTFPSGEKYEGYYQQD